MAASARPTKRMRLSSVVWHLVSHSRNLRSRFVLSPAPSHPCQFPSKLHTMMPAAPQLIVGASSTSLAMLKVRDATFDQA